MRKSSLLFFCLLLPLSWTVQAERRPATPDFVLLLDTSLSMAVSDPRRLLPKAVELLLNLMPPQSHIEVLGFDRDVHGRTELLLLDEAKRRELADFVQALVTNPAIGANFQAPFEAVINTLGRQPPAGNPRAVLLFSDGIVNVGNEEENRRHKNTVLEQTAEQLAEFGVRVFTVAFSTHVDTDFLRGIAERTGGLAIIAGQAEQLAEVFMAIFEMVDQPDMLPIGNVIHVDEHVDSLSLLLSHNNGTQKTPALVSPQGEAIDAHSQRSDIRWSTGSAYSLVAMDHPQQGDWQLRAGDNSQLNKAYIMTDVSLQINAPTVAGGGKPMPLISAWLEKNGTPFTDPAIHIQAEISAINDPASPAKVEEMVDSDDDGRYEAILPALAPGSYQILFRADAGKLRRIKKHGLNIIAAPASTRSETTVGKTGSDQDALIALGWINLALLPIAGMVFFYRLAAKRKQLDDKEDSLP